MKVSLLQKRLKKQKISHLLLFNNDPNFTYFTRLKNLSFSLLAFPQKGKPLLFLTSLDQEKPTGQTRNILLKKPLAKTLKKYLRPKAIAYNSSSLTLSQYKKLKKIFPKTKFKDFSRNLSRLRAEKTEKEILYLRKAAQLTAQAFQQIITRLKKKKFKTENDIKFFLQKFALDHHTELSFPPIVASGKNTCRPHHQTSNKRLAEGFLLLDFGLSYQHYCSDLTRMLYLGKPTKKEQELYHFLLTIQENTITNLQPGLKAGEVEKQTRRYLGKYSSYFTHGLGHGLGIEIHESPSLKPESLDRIKKNQVFTIEPGLYFKNFGLRIEDTLLMEDQPEILTAAPKHLIIIKKPNIF